MNNSEFERLVASGKQVGEVIGVDKFLVRARGLQPINTHAVVMFADGTKGYIHHVYEDYVVILHLGAVPVSMGMIVVLQFERLVARVGKNYIGRVINVIGEPLDGKGPIEPDGTWPIFHTAPLLYERELLDTSLETGITALDILFSLARGQRMALLGDGKSGKSSLATQIAINQRDTDITTIYVLVGKRRADLIELIDRLETNNAMHKTIIVASNMFESLVMNYLAPYVGAAIGEYFWQELAMDTLVIYDDLTAHGMAYREISLLAGVSPGRDSYPGDMFYTHSSLVERAGKLNRNHASQTILPLIYAPGGDITAYLPTNVMSMTDGQWILDMEVFREVMRPAISTAFSVTRVGGVAQNKRQKALGQLTSKSLSAYRQADEYAHFGSELSEESEAALVIGKNLYKLFNQVVGETYSLMDQQFLLDIVLNAKPGEQVDVAALKAAVREFSARVENDDDETKSNYDALRDELRAKVVSNTQPEKPAVEPDAEKTEEPATDEKEDKKSKKKHDKHDKNDDHEKEKDAPKDEVKTDSAEPPADAKTSSEETKADEAQEASDAAAPAEDLPKTGDVIAPQASTEPTENPEKEAKA